MRDYLPRLKATVQDSVTLAGALTPSEWETIRADIEALAESGSRVVGYLETSRSLSGAVPANSAPSQPVSLPPERQLHTTLSFEDAVSHASAMIDLLACKLQDEERGGENEHVQPPWLSAIVILADHVRWRLQDQFKAYHEEVRRLQFPGEKHAS